MKDELQGKLVEILSSIQTAAGKASDFAMEQLPDIAQSYVLYGRVTATLLSVVFFVMAACGAWAVYWASFKCPPKYRTEPTKFIVGLCGAFGFVIGGMLSLVHIHTTLLVWFAPKVWLLKEIAGMIR